MVRLCYLFLAVTLVLGPASALVIRAELMEPGVQFIPEHLLHLYNRLVSAHGHFSLLAMMLMGLCLGAVAQAEGHPAPRQWLIPGLLVAVIYLLSPFVLALVFGQQADVGRGWTFYPPQDPDAPSQPLLGVWLWLVTSPLIMVLGLSAVALGGAAWLTVPGHRQWGRAVAWVTVASAVASIVVHSATDLNPAISSLIALMPIFSLGALAAGVAFTKNGRPGLHLAVGGLFVLIYAATLAPMMRASTLTFQHDTYYVIAHVHSTVFAFAVFAGFAALIAWLRPRISAFVLGLHAVLLGLANWMTFLPQAFLGTQGMPRRYVDYPATFEMWNAISSIGALISASLTLLGIVVIVWRRTRRQGARPS